MSSNSEYEHQKYWEEQEEKFKEQLNKDCETCNIDTSIPLGEGIMAQIERMPVQEYNPDNLTIKSIEDWINSINKYKKDGESEGGRW